MYIIISHCCSKSRLQGSGGACVSYLLTPPISQMAFFRPHLGGLAEEKRLEWALPV